MPVLVDHDVSCEAARHRLLDLNCIETLVAAITGGLDYCLRLGNVNEI